MAAPVPSAELLKHLQTIRAGRDIQTTDLVSIEDLSVEEILLVFQLAREVEVLLQGKEKKVGWLKGRSQLNFFLENSTRTRTSFELAGKNLGIDTINISGSQSSLKKGESLLDTAITLDEMQPDLLVVRSPYSGTARYLARNMRAAVFNAGDGWNEHPTQALIELFVMLKRFNNDVSQLSKVRYVVIGDVLHSRVFGSLARLCGMFGLNITVCAPHTLVRPRMSEVWPHVSHEPQLSQALQQADVIHVIRLQTERAASAFVPSIREYSKTYGINAEKLKLAKPDAFVMHAGPVIREMDVHTNILETDRSVISEQVFAGYCLRFVLLWLLADKREQKQVEPRLFKVGGRS